MAGRPAGHAHLVLIDESGQFLNPLVRRSWALKGKTPVIGGDGGHRKKASVIGAVSVSPAAHRLGLHFATLPDGLFTAETVAEFLRNLLKHLRGRWSSCGTGAGTTRGRQSVRSSGGTPDWR